MSFSPQVAPAVKMAALLALAGLYMAAGIGLWLALVPIVISPQTFGWMSALAFVVAIVSGSTIVRAQSTRSIAHVLYDVEHPSKPSAF